MCVCALSLHLSKSTPMSARRSVRGREAVVAATPAGAGEEERAPADAVGEEHAHQDEARLDRPDGHGGGAVRLHTDRLEHQRAVEEDGVDAGRCTKNCSPTAHVRHGCCVTLTRSLHLTEWGHGCYQNWQIVLKDNE